MQQYGHYGGVGTYNDPDAERRRKWLHRGAIGAAAGVGGYALWRGFKRRSEPVVRGAYNVPKTKPGFFGSKPLSNAEGIAQRANEIRHNAKLSTRIKKRGEALRRHRDLLTVKSGKPVGRWAAFRSFGRTARRIARVAVLRR